jgi:myo-inositol-1-phosphate synthase
MQKNTIRIAIVGVGNCASSLIQGIEFYGENSQKNPKFEALGLMHLDIGGYKPWDIQVGAAFDIDKRKVGKPLKEAIFAKPNCTKIIYPNLNDSGVIVSMGEVLDGVSEHMKDYPEERVFLVADEKPCHVEKVLKDSGVDILLNYLPVGSDRATEFYAEACLNTGVSLINCMPSFIASERNWARRFEEKGIPIVGDDVKSQMGATIIHRALAKLFEDRGVRLDRTYQINTGGNTDFLNMLNRNRLRNKRISKTEAIQSQLDIPLEPENIHIGPSDYVPWQNDNKVCFIRMEGRGFGEVPLNLELRLSVEDSPNSGGMTIDAIRCCQIARERGIAGPLLSISAYAMKHPIVQFPDNLAKSMVEEFIAGKRER